MAILGERIKGYRLNIQVGNNKIRGLETAGFKIKPNYEETILKEMAGSAEEELIDFDAQMTFSGKCYEKDGAETWHDFETLRELAFAGTQISFTYGLLEVGEAVVTGTGVITDFGEDANSKDTATFSGTIDADKGSVAFGTYSAPA
jgi:hypothetical protein